MSKVNQLKKDMTPREQSNLIQSSLVLMRSALTKELEQDNRDRRLNECERSRRVSALQIKISFLTSEINKIQKELES
jgi:hypothetical protein